MTSDRLFPPGIYGESHEAYKTSVLNDRSFFIPDNDKPGYESIYQPPDEEHSDIVTFSPNASYGKYMKMHKVFLGSKGAWELEDIHARLREEYMPRYLVTAGWAAIEAAILQSEKPLNQRMNLLEDSSKCLEKALRVQQRFNEIGHESLKQYDYPYRIALDLAVLPLFKGIVQGDVTEETCREVFEDCLNIAQANSLQMHLAKKAGHVQALGEHSGFAFECNALLALNRYMSPTRFVVPSMPRSDDGYHHRRQSHDLLLINQKWGKLRSATPVEIKSSASRRDRQRYIALLVRGKMHLSVDGKYLPENTLQAITAVYEGTPCAEEKSIVGSVSERFSNMTRDYIAGEKLGDIACKKSVTDFRDNSIVMLRHPGLQTA